MSSLISAELSCVACGVDVEHKVNTVNRWATPKAHVAGDRICCQARRLTQEQLDEILEGEPEPVPCPDCGEDPCHPDCLSGGGL